MERLTLDGAQRRGVSLPAHAGRTRAGIVHLGIGAFARAHTALFTDVAMTVTGDDRWGVIGVSQRSPIVPDQLRPQDCLYSVTARSDNVDSTAVVASLSDVIPGREQPADVVDALASPDVQVVTLTVTEKGYRLRPDGRLDLDDDDIRADLAGGARTAIGQLAEGILARGGAPLTLVSCDNLLGNGRLLGGALAEYADALGGARGASLALALVESVRTPSTMVDRMVPATTEGSRRRAAARLGMRDEAAVVAEPFHQWVLTDDFAGERPAWESAGAIFVDDIAPWEDAKLRILNAGHSLTAYLGHLAGADTIAESIGDDAWRRAVIGLIDDDAVPLLALPDQLDPERYRDEVLQRFANPHLGHTVAKVGADGSQKIGPRLCVTLRDARRAGREPRWAALAVAAWGVFLRDTAPADIIDPRADELVSVARAGRPRQAGVRALSLIDPEIAADPTVASMIEDWTAIVDCSGVAGLRKVIHAQF